MKLSSRILLALLLVYMGGLLSSNNILKKEFDKVDKSDLYWTYSKLLQAPFKYLKIKGGNITNIAFEQSHECSVRILEDWRRYHRGHIQASVKDDTLYIDFDFIPNEPFEKFWMQTITPVRIFSPELLSIEGFDTKLEMYKMKQRNFTVKLSGKSSFEVESMIPDLDSINIDQKDSSEIVFEMSPEYKSTVTLPMNGNSVPAKDNPGVRIQVSPNTKSNEAMQIRSIVARVQGNSLLDVGHAQIENIKLDIADSSGILLSGNALKKVHSE